LTTNFFWLKFLLDEINNFVRIFIDKRLAF
jgi:hypothetical protein